MIPPRHAMEALVLSLEEELAKDGWDNEPLLGIVVRVTPPPSPDLDMYAVLPFPVQPADLSDQPAQSLLYIGGKMNQPDAPPALTPRQRRNLAGVLFAGEGWQAPPSKDDTYAELARKGVRFADVVGSKEVRFVHVIDCSGRYTSVNRARGEEPKTWVVEPGEQKERVAGNVVIGLRDLLLGLGRHMRPDAMDREAIAALARRDSPDE